MKDSLTIKALKYVAQRNGEFKPVEIKQFLLDNFPEKPEMSERIEMKRFIKYLEKSNFIELISEEGLWIIQIAGKRIPREEISSYIKITAKGFEIICESDRNKKNSFSFYLSIFLGLTSLLFMILNYSNAEDLKTSQIELNSARDSLTTQILKYNKLNVQHGILKQLYKEK